MSRRSGSIGVAVGAVAAAFLAVPGVAPATTVNLRVEGASETLFEGPVRAMPASLTSNTGEHPGLFPCNVAENGGSGGRAANPISALASRGLALGLNWFPEYTGFIVESVSAEDPADPYYWDFFVDGKGAAELGYPGGCQLALRKGSSIVWTVTSGSEPLLKLRVSGSARSARVTATVTNATTGAPVKGARVGSPGGPLTTATGRARIERPAAGSRTLKATRAGAIRSNAVVVRARR